MESENKPIPVMISNDALSLKGWMMGMELEEGLTRTPIIQRNLDRGGKEKSTLLGLFFYQPPVRGLDPTLLQPFLPAHIYDQEELIKQGLQPSGGSFLDKTWGVRSRNRDFALWI